jgi:hypothetical protein
MPLGDGMPGVEMPQQRIYVYSYVALQLFLA